MSGAPADNYDREQLLVEVDYRGWILGESALPVTLGATGGDWEDVLGQLQHVRLVQAVSVEDGAFFKPQASTLTVAAETLEVLDLYNRVVRLVYGTTTLCTGTVRLVTGSAAPDPTAPADPVAYALAVTATSSSDTLNRAQLVGFTAPLEDVSARIARVWPPAALTDLPARNMPAVGPVTTDVLTALYEASKVAGALFCFDELNRAQLGAGHFDYRGPDPLVWTFVDDGSAGDSFRGLDLAQDIDAVNTALTVTAASDTTITYSRQSPGAVLANHASVVVDVVPTTDNVRAIAESLPLATFVPIAPTSLRARVDWRELTEISRPRLLDRVEVYLQGRAYDGVVLAITDEITPTEWITTYQLGPGILLERTFDDLAPVKPSPVRNLATTARTTSTITLHWDVPNVPGGALGYVVRRAPGAVAPATPTAGTGVGAGTLDLGTVTITDTGRTSATDYAYAVFVVTEDPDVWTRATTASWTTPNLPTPVVTITGTGTYSADLDWTASTLDTGDWLITLTVTQGGFPVFSGSTTRAAAEREVVTVIGAASHGPATATATVQARRTLHGVTYLGVKTTKTSTITL